MSRTSKNLKKKLLSRKSRKSRNYGRIPKRKRFRHMRRTKKGGNFINDGIDDVHRRAQTAIHKIGVAAQNARHKAALAVASLRMTAKNTLHKITNRSPKLN
jgi:hypothetical protein